MKEFWNLLFFVIFVFGLTACHPASDKKLVNESADSTITLEGAGE